MKIKQIFRSLPKDACYGEIDSPVGVLTLLVSDKGLHAVLWPKNLADSQCRDHLHQLKHTDSHEFFLKAKQQLSEYFEGKRKTFDLPLVLEGTDFQINAWQQLLKIPYGKTLSYGEQAANLGNKNKARAVGLANNRNPISIIIPCHRVIGKNGKLTGFGGGLDVKGHLLDFEAEFIS